MEVAPGVFMQSMPPEYEPDPEARPAELELAGARKVDAVLELVLLDDGRRGVVLESLLFALRRVLEVSPPSNDEPSELERELVLLAQSVDNAIEAPLPGHTPTRADAAAGIPGLELVAPAFDEGGRKIHPGAADDMSGLVGERALELEHRDRDGDGAA